MKAAGQMAKEKNLELRRLVEELRLIDDTLERIGTSSSCSCKGEVMLTIGLRKLSETGSVIVLNVR